MRSVLRGITTNKTWQNTEKLFSGEAVPIDVTRDFFDYFIFGSRGERLSDKLGLNSLSLRYDAQGKGVAVSKDLSDKLEGKYEIEEKKKDENNTTISQKVGAEYKLTDAISVEAK